MTREEKTKLLKKELHFITNISSKYDMNKPSEAARIKRALSKDGDMFKTSMGTVYSQRLDEIIDDLPVSMCCLCSKEEAVDKVICRSCMKKFSGGKQFFTEIAAKEESVAEEAVAEEAVTEEAVTEETVAEKVTAKELVVEEETVAEEPTVAKTPTTETIEAETEEPEEDIFGEAEEEWKRSVRESDYKQIDDFFGSDEDEYEEYEAPNMYRRVLIPGLAIAGIFLIVLIGIVVNRYGKGKPVADENGVEFIISTNPKAILNDATDARNYVDEHFSWMDGWEISFDGDYEIPTGWNWTPVGMPVQYTDNAFLTIDGGKYVEDMNKTAEGWKYSVKKEVPGGNQQGYLYIDRYGGAYLTGNFENCPVEKYIYRVK